LGRTLGGAVALGLAWLAAAGGSAYASNRVYWSDFKLNRLSEANLDGSGSGADLNTTGATVKQPAGVAIDPAAGKLYWANEEGNRISFANLDGSGGGDLNTAGATVNGPTGVAIDPVAGRLYWANERGNAISFANLNGTGGADLGTAGATVSKPYGLAIDPARNKIFWTNAKEVAAFMFEYTIAFAKLDGTGSGGTFNTTGATVHEADGLAIDPALNRVFWANYGAGKISFAKLDDTGGGGDLNTTGATVAIPLGVAIDPAANRIYWANFTAGGSEGSIAFANADDTGSGGNISTSGATDNSPLFPALLEMPVAAGAPTIAGAGKVGAALSCGPGAWGADSPESFLFRAPRSFSYSWQLNGHELPGVAGSSFTPSRPGSYACRVTATNQAGATSQASAPLQVSSVAAAPSLVGLSETNSTFAPAKGSTPVTGQTAKRHKRGTTFTFSLDEPASVTVQIQRKAPGRRVRHVCKRSSKKLHRKPRCTLYSSLATLTRTGHAGANKLPFTARIQGRALKPGHYRALFSAANAVGSSPSETITFTVVAR
jgi:DNA-binding beta-propeller fold protein YncE